jgi:hypothetical protein
MSEASVSFAGNLTDQPEVRYAEGGIAKATFRVRCRAGGSSVLDFFHPDLDGQAALASVTCATSWWPTI